LIYSIRKQIAELPITCSWRWIEGHQDDKPGSAKGTLDEWAKLNIRMDRRAKRHWMKTYERATPPNQRFQHERVVIRLHGRKLSKIDAKELYVVLFEPIIKPFWQKKLNLSEDDWQNIHWKAAGQAMKRAPVGRKKWIFKHASGHCGVGRMLQIRGQQEHSKCPRCDQDQETTEHVSKCPSAEAQAQWNTSINKLRDWMATAHTSPNLTTAILARLREWRDGTPRVAATGTRLTQTALKEQESIGWHAFLLGFASSKLAEVQQEYFASLKMMNTGERWLSALITKLQQTAWDMWDNRNDVKHNSITARKQAEIDAVSHAVRAQYDLGTAGLPCSRLRPSSAFRKNEAMAPVSRARS